MNRIGVTLEILREKARNKQIIYYSDLAALIGLDMGEPPDRIKIGEILDQINRDEAAEGRPMLSALVIHKEGGLPGTGFFKLARDLRRFSGPEDTFHVREVNAVYEAYKRL